VNQLGPKHAPEIMAYSSPEVRYSFKEVFVFCIINGVWK
jgi:hypothetical protein